MTIDGFGSGGAWKDNSDWQKEDVDKTESRKGGKSSGRSGSSSGLLQPKDLKLQSKDFDLAPPSGWGMGAYDEPWQQSSQPPRSAYDDDHPQSGPKAREPEPSKKYGDPNRFHRSPKPPKQQMPRKGPASKAYGQGYKFGVKATWEDVSGRLLGPDQHLSKDDLTSPDANRQTKFAAVKRFGQLRGRQEMEEEHQKRLKDDAVMRNLPKVHVDGKDEQLLDHKLSERLKSKARKVRTPERDKVTKDRRFLTDYYKNIERGRTARNRVNQQWKKEDAANRDRSLPAQAAKEIKEKLAAPAKSKVEFGRKQKERRVEAGSLSEKLLTPNLTTVVPFVADRAKEAGYKLDTAKAKLLEKKGDWTTEERIADAVRGAAAKALSVAAKKVGKKIKARAKKGDPRAAKDLSRDELHVQRLGAKLDGAEQNTLDLHLIDRDALKAGKKALRGHLKDHLSSDEIDLLEDEFDGWIQEYNQEASVEVSRLRQVRQDYDKSGLLPLGAKTFGSSRAEFSETQRATWNAAFETSTKAGENDLTSGEKRWAGVLKWMSNWSFLGYQNNAWKNHFAGKARSYTRGLAEMYGAQRMGEHVESAFEKESDKVAQKNYDAAKEWVMSQYELQESDDVGRYWQTHQQDAPFDPGHLLAAFGAADDEEEIISAIEKQLTTAMDGDYTYDELEEARQRPGVQRGLVTLDDIVEMRQEKAKQRVTDAEKTGAVNYEAQMQSNNYVRAQAEAIYAGIRDGLLDSSIEQALLVGTGSNKAGQRLFWIDAHDNMEIARANTNRRLVNMVNLGSKNGNRLADFEVGMKRVAPAVEQAREIVAKDRELGNDADITIDYRDEKLRLHPQFRKDLAMKVDELDKAEASALTAAKVVDRIVGGSNHPGHVDKEGIVEIDDELSALFASPTIDPEERKEDFRKLRDGVKTLRKELADANLDVERPEVVRVLTAKLDNLDKRINDFEHLFDDFAKWDDYIEKGSGLAPDMVRGELLGLRGRLEAFGDAIKASHSMEDPALIDSRVRMHLRYYNTALLNTVAHADAYSHAFNEGVRLSNAVQDDKMSLDDALAEWHVASQPLRDLVELPRRETQVSDQVHQRSAEQLDSGLGTMFAAGAGLDVKKQVLPPDTGEATGVLARAGVLDSRFATAVDEFLGKGAHPDKRMERFEREIVNVLLTGEPSRMASLANTLFKDDPGQALRVQQRVLRQTMLERGEKEPAIQEAVDDLVRQHSARHAQVALESAVGSSKVREMFGSVGVEIENDPTWGPVGMVQGLPKLTALMAKVYGTDAKALGAAGESLGKILDGRVDELSPEEARDALQLAQQLENLAQTQTQNDRRRVTQLTQGLDYSLGIPKNANDAAVKSAAERALNASSDPELGDLNERLLRNQQQVNSQLAAASMVHGAFVESFKEAAPLIGAKADADDPMKELRQHGQSLKTLDKMVQLRQISDDMRDFSEGSQRLAAARKQMVQLANDLKDKTLDAVKDESTLTGVVDKLRGLMPQSIKSEKDAKRVARELDNQNFENDFMLGDFTEMTRNLRTLEALNRSTDQIKGHIAAVSKEHRELMSDVQAHRTDQLLAKLVLEEYSRSGQSLADFKLDAPAVERLQKRAAELNVLDAWQDFQQEHFADNSGAITDEFLSRFERSGTLPRKLRDRAEILNEKLAQVGQLADLIGATAASNQGMLNHVDKVEQPKAVEPPQPPKLAKPQTFGEAFPQLTGFLTGDEKDVIKQLKDDGVKVKSSKVRRRMRAAQREKLDESRKSRELWRNFMVSQGTSPENLASMSMVDGLREFHRLLGAGYGHNKGRVLKDLTNLQGMVKDTADREQHLREAQRMRRELPFLGPIADVSALGDNLDVGYSDVSARDGWMSNVQQRLNRDLINVNKQFKENLEQLQE